MSHSETSQPALLTAGVDAYPPTRESLLDTVEVPASVGTDRDGSNADGTSPAAVFLSADLE